MCRYLTELMGSRQGQAWGGENCIIAPHKLGSVFVP